MHCNLRFVESIEEIGLMQSDWSSDDEEFDWLTDIKADAVERLRTFTNFIFSWNFSELFWTLL